MSLANRLQLLSMSITAVEPIRIQIWKRAESFRGSVDEEEDAGLTNRTERII